MSIDFLLTSLIIIVSPGTGVLYTLAAGLSRGSRASVVAAFGCTLGIVPHMAAAIMGLAALLHTSAVAFQTFKYLGVAYLLWMAWSALRERGALRVETEAGADPQSSLLLHGALVLSAVFMALTFAVFVVYGLCAASVRRHIISRPRVLTWMRRAFAGAFVALGAKLALAER